MASAQTEPSMDEILASIRRIISEEDDGTPEVPVRRKLEALELTDETPEAEEPGADEAAPEPEAKAEPEAPQAEEPETPAGSDHVTEDAARGEATPQTPTDALDDFEPMPEQPVAGVATMEPAAVAHDAGQVEDTTFDAPANEPAAEEPKAQDDRAPAQATQPDPVSVAVSEEVAGLAASAFGALEENVRLTAGSSQTIEDLVQAMLRPMLKDWLEANLPRIVEEKVEEEVRRIARRR